MTISNQTTKVTGNGNGAATSFSFNPMIIFDEDELEVYTVATDGTETLRSLGSGSTNYSVTPDSGTYPSTTGVSGSVVYPADLATPLVTGEKIVIKRVLTIEQSTDLGNQGGYFPDVQEATFDKGIIIDLQQQEELDRRIKVPISDTVVDLTIPDVATRANKTFIWDASGLPSAGSVSTATVSAAMEPVVGATTVASALSLLGGFGADDPGIDLNMSEGADVASASTTDVWITDGNFFHITGTTTITSLGTAPNAGAWRVAIFDGALTLTNGANLILPGGANITTAAGDMMLVYADTTTQHRVVYWPVDGKPVVSLTWQSGDIATGTDGEIPTWDSSGDPATVSAGTIGQVLTSNGAGAAPTFKGWTYATFDLTNGGSNDLTLLEILSSLPSGGVSEIDIGVAQCSTNGAAGPIVQFSVSSSYVTSGYDAIAGVATGSTQTFTAGFPAITDAAHVAGIASYPFWSLKRIGTNTWWCRGTLTSDTASAQAAQGSGYITLAGEPDAVRITTVGGTATFDGGSAGFVRYR